uniref:Uncharacterized protein n=1 Tax=Prymnesium polylepis TaxID=72548 RepID=A0A7S4HV90_9EUKA
MGARVGAFGLHTGDRDQPNPRRRESSHESHASVRRHACSGSAPAHLTSLAPTARRGGGAAHGHASDSDDEQREAPAADTTTISDHHLRHASPARTACAPATRSRSATPHFTLFTSTAARAQRQHRRRQPPGPIWPDLAAVGALRSAACVHAHAARRPVPSALAMALVAMACGQLKRT